MTKAQQLRKAILERKFVHLSMKDGYGTEASGNTIRFKELLGENPEEVKSNYNKAGKCVKFTGVFSDKSKIEYTYNTRHHQFKLKAK